jgi:hypothetical protein
MTSILLDFYQTGLDVLKEDLFIERTTPQAPTKPNTRKPARLAIEG